MEKRWQKILSLVLFLTLVVVIIAGKIHDNNIEKTNAIEAEKYNKTQLENKPKEISDNSNKKYQGKIWNAIGDSITFLNGYEPIVKETLGFSDYRNYGKSGYTTEMLSNEINNWDANADLITFFAGTNDFGRDLDLSVTKASTEKIFSSLKEKYSNKTIIVILPLQRWGYVGDTQPEKTMTNSKGITLRQYCDTIAQVAVAKNFKVIDMYNDSGITKDNINTFTVDGLHPNSDGNQKIASVIIDNLKKL